MSWGPAILAGIACGVVGAALTMMAAGSLVRLFRISSFEGASGYAVVFLLVPLGFVVGLVTGIALLRMTAPAGAAAVGLQLGLAILATAGLLTAGYGAAYLLRSHPPQIDGAPLALDIEIRFRPVPGEDPRDEILRASLYGGGDDNHYIDVDTARSEGRDGWIVMPCRADLRSRSHRRIVSVIREDQPTQSFLLPLEATPARSDTAWSGWIASTPSATPGAPPLDPAKACELRFRLRIGS